MKKLIITMFISLFLIVGTSYAGCHSEYLCDSYGNCEWVEVCDSAFDTPMPKVYMPRITPIIPPKSPSIAPIPSIGTDSSQQLYNPDKKGWGWYHK